MPYQFAVLNLSTRGSSEMKDFNIVNLNQLTWQINLAIAGGVFAIFSLIYNEYYIYYGLLTFAFGILGHIGTIFFDWFFHIDENHKYVDQRYYWVAHATTLILFIFWILFLLNIYC